MGKKCPACGFDSNSSFLSDCERCDCPLEAQPTNEEKSLYLEVAKRRKRAKDLKLPELFGNLYHSKLKYYPAWIKNEGNREYVCSLVTEADVVDKEKIKIKLNGRDYFFEFKEFNFSTPDGISCTNANLILFSSDKKVLDVSMHIAYDNENEYDTPKWGSFDSESFIEGEWIKDFKELEQRIPIEERQREKRQADKANQEKVKKMKEDLGF